MLKILRYFTGDGAKMKTDAVDSVDSADIENQLDNVRHVTLAPMYFQKASDIVNMAVECAMMSYHVIFKNDVIMSVVGLFIPMITTTIGMRKNELFNDFKDDDDRTMLIMMFVVYEIMSFVIQDYFAWKQSYKISIRSKIAIRAAKIKCSVKIPGVNIAECDEINEHLYKINEFAVVPGMIWSTFVSFVITINGVESFTSKIVIAISSFTTLLMLICINDSSLYEREKYDHTKITNICDADLAHIRHSFGATIDYDHSFKRMYKQIRQGNIQKIVVCFLNFVIICVTLTATSKHYVLNFMSVTWLISRLADNIKGLQYYSFVKKYFDICECLARHEYKWSKCSVDKVDVSSVRLDNVSYGYLDNLQDCVPNIKLKNLTYTFNTGSIYYIEAPNGVGKSTLLRTFTHNITGGDIFFGDTNRLNMSWDQLHSAVFHLVQASEFCPAFRKEDIDSRKDSDPYLAKGLCIVNLFGKSSSEMSGGEKQRMNIYLALTSNAPVVLLDEILSEISVIPSNEHPNGLRATVISAILDWSNRVNKLIIIVGHGVFDKYTNSDVIKLKINTDDSLATTLVPLK